VPVEGVTEPAADAPPRIRAVRRRQRVAQWSVPVLTGALIAVSALAGEQQKPGSVARGVGGRLRGMLVPAR
jgi:hypothetical protein